MGEGGSLLLDRVGRGGGGVLDQEKLYTYYLAQASIGGGFIVLVQFGTPIPLFTTICIYIPVCVCVWGGGYFTRSFCVCVWGGGGGY